jgi:alpha-tubulin suppressor-like RCC1 family protein
VRKTGAVVCWGSEQNGALGDDVIGTTTLNNQLTPVMAIGIDDGVAIASYMNFAVTCALRKSGTVSCWGYNGNGNLGSGDAQPYVSPLPLPVAAPPPSTGNLANAKAVNPSCALRADNTEVCWGYAGYGQLGVQPPLPPPNAFYYAYSPVTVSQDGAPAPFGSALSVVRMASGGTGPYSEHRCAIVNGGTLLCWGSNYNGQLGQGFVSFSTNATPTPVLQPEAGGLVNITSAAIATGDTCAVTSDGHLFCWGRNNSGQLGIGSVTDNPTAQPVHGF